MKKTILALMIPALFATSASAVEIYSAEDGSKVDLYGRLQYNAGALGYQDDVIATAADESNEAQNFGGEGLARLGINVKYVLNQDTSLIGKYEANVAAESDAKKGVDTRYSWLGFRFNDTTDLTFGKSEAARAQLTDLTDTFDIFGGEVTDAGGTNRVDDQVRLAYAENGVDLRATYAFSDERKETAYGDNNLNTTAGVSAGYTLPIDLGFVASYTQYNFSNLDQDFGIDKVNEWGAGAHYSVDGFYFAGLYGQRDAKTKGTFAVDSDFGTKFWEVQAAYNVQEWTLIANYANEKGRKSISGEKITDEYTLAARYAFTPKTKVYAEYVINEIKGEDDLYGVGIQYNF